MFPLILAIEEVREWDDDTRVVFRRKVGEKGYVLEFEYLGYSTGVQVSYALTYENAITLVKTLQRCLSGDFSEKQAILWNEQYTGNYVFELVPQLAKIPTPLGVFKESYSLVLYCQRINSIGFPLTEDEVEQLILEISTYYALNKTPA